MSPAIYPNFLQALKLIGLYILILIPISFIGDFLLADDLLQMLVTYIASLTIIVFIGYRKKTALEGRVNIVNGGTGNIYTTASILLAALSIPFFLDPLYWILPRTGLDDLADREFAKVIQPNVISFLSIVIAPALLEELFFRGIILDGFIGIYKTRKAVLLSALLFGLIHMNVQQFFAGFTIGILIGWVYAKTRMIIFCMAIHALNNLLQYLYYLKFGKKGLMDVLGVQLYFVTVIGFLGLFILLILYLNKQFAKTNPAYKMKEESLT